MSTQRDQPDQQRQHGGVALLRRMALRLWTGRLYSEAAKAAFWQTLSLFPLLLGLLGLVGYIGDWFGHGVVTAVQSSIVGLTTKIFAPNVVTSLIAPTVQQILTTAQGGIATISFVISLWAGSSAMSTFVDAITTAHGQYSVRNQVWQRTYALLLYLVGLLCAVVGLPLLAVGPGYLPKFFPHSWQENVSTLVNIFYYPGLALLITLALATLYKVALPRKLPWTRGLPGAVLAMLLFIVASIGLRIYIAHISKTGYSYGALAAPIAFLLLTFMIGLAIVIGAHLNAAIQEQWPAKMTRRQRRKWRRLEMVRADEQIKNDEAHEAWHAAQDTPVRADQQDPKDSAEDTKRITRPVEAPSPNGAEQQVAQAQESSPPPRGIPL